MASFPDARLRNRAAGKAGPSTALRSPDDDLHDEHIVTDFVCGHVSRSVFSLAALTPSSSLFQQRQNSSIDKFLETDSASMAVVAVLTALAFALRFYKINHPDQVVCVYSSL